MKQKLLYICLLILCALAWSGELWGITKGTITYDNWYNDVTPSKGNGVGFYVCSVNTKNFLSASNRSMSSADNATIFYWVSSGSKLQSTYNGTTYHLNVGVSDQSVTTGGTNTASTIEFKSQDGYYAIGGGYWLLNNNGTTLDRKAKTGNNYQQSKWYLVSSDQYSRFLKLKNEYVSLQTNAYNAINNGTYSKSNLPDTYYNNIVTAIGVSLSLSSATATINTAYDNLKSLYDNLATVSSAYTTAKNTTLPGKQSQSTNNNPSGVADEDIESAYTTLENATSVSEINDAVALVKNFDTIVWDVNQMRINDEKTDPASAHNDITYASSDDEIISVSGNKIIANAAGSAIITASTSGGNGYYAVTATKTVTVVERQVANDLSVSLSTQDTYVGNTINVTFSNQNNTESPITCTITEQSLSTEINVGTNVITYSNGVITAHNAGTAKIQFHQESTEDVKSFDSQVYLITVSKIANPITITSLGGGTATNITLKYGATASLVYTATNTDTSPVVTPATGSYSSYSNGTITAGNSAGTDIYEIIQAETYKYDAGYTSFTIRVNNTDEAVGYVLYYDDESYTGNWSEGATLTMSGPGDLLSFQATKNMDTAVGDMIVKTSTNGSDWPTLESIGVGSLNKNDYKPFSYGLNDEAIRYIRFDNDGSYRRYYKDVKVRRKTYVRASANKTDLGTLYTDQTDQVTITVSYSSTNGGNINISSSNSHFVASVGYLPVESGKTATSSKGTSYICGVDGTQTFTVTYIPDPDHLGTETTDITIGDQYNFATVITLTATSKKYATSIARGSNPIVETTIGGSISNAFSFSGTSSTYPSADDSDDFYYTISHTPNTVEVISYDPATGTVKGLNAGEATLTITQKKTNLYHYTSESFVFTVNKLEDDDNIDLSTLSFYVDGNATVLWTNAAADNDGAITVTYEEDDITYTNVLQNREGGFISYSAREITGKNAGSGRIKVTRAETDKYVAKKVYFDITVNKFSQTLTWDNDDIETYIKTGHTLEGNTARSDAPAADNVTVTYSSSDTDYITVNPSTGVLTGEAVGDNIVITASQEGNYKYLPATQLTRQFSVTNKQIPVFTPDVDFSGMSRQMEYSDVATITVADVSSGDDFTITKGDNTILDVVRSGETITIKALKVGSTTLTLTQEGNDGYIGRSKTYNIVVFWPDDFLALSSSTSPSYTEDTYRKVFFNNTLKSGYSTIALPFNTTVENIVGDSYDADVDWVAQLSVVTYNAQDGYSLYFEKKSEIVANQPYILHLGTAVNSPVFTNVSVVAAATASQNATKGVNLNKWTMHSNYTPGFDMEGYYGIAGEKIKKGTEGATLSAFRAYIEGPADPSVQVKAAYLDYDEADGLLEVLRGEAHSAESVYDLQGRQLPKAQRGLNIIRGADGVVRKVLKK